MAEPTPPRSLDDLHPILRELFLQRNEERALRTGPLRRLLAFYGITEEPAVAALEEVLGRFGRAGRAADAPEAVVIAAFLFGLRVARKKLA